MTRDEVLDLYITAAEVDRRLPDTARPAVLKAQALPYVHSWEDQLGWGSARYEEEREAFWQSQSTRLQTADVATWERANELVLIVTRDRDRRCLWAYASSKAGGKPFSKWCKDREHVHRNYGKECADRAINQISEWFLRDASINCMVGVLDALHETPEIGHIPVNIEEPRRFVWMAPGAFMAQADHEARSFDWALKRNEQRRQREAKRQQSA